MEKFALPKFEYKADNLSACLNLTEKEEHYVKNAIIFETLACPIIVTEFYNSVDEAPESLKCMAGILERVSEHMKSAEQQLFMLIAFADGYYNITKEVEKVGKAIEAGQTDFGDARALTNIVSKMAGHKVDSVIGSMETIKKCNMDFDRYIEEMMNDDEYDMSGNYIVSQEVKPEDISELLKNMFKAALEAKKKAEEENKEDKDKKDE